MKQREGDQPLPQGGGEDATSVMLEYLRMVWKDGSGVVEFAEARVQIGIERYGQTLHTFDGRDAVRDLDEELADAITYTVKAILEGEPLPLRTLSLLTTLNLLVGSWVKFGASTGSLLRRMCSKGSVDAARGFSDAIKEKMGEIKRGQQTGE